MTQFQSFIPFIALATGGLALYLTTRRYFLKLGTKISGAFTLCSSVDCDDKYISRVMLENLKDRATTIYAIYLKVGHGCYVEVEDFEDDPLVLKAFESYQKEFDAIERYEVSTKRIRLNKLLNDKKAKKRLYLSTPIGKYRVKTPIRPWNPIIEFFQNHMTAVVRPIRSKYKDRAYGSNIRYLVELKFGDGKEQVLPIHSKEAGWRSHFKFQITEEALDSKISLKVFFLGLIEKGVINAKTIEVYDLDEWRGEQKRFNVGKEINADRYSWFRYYLFGRLLTYLSNRKMRIENRKRKKSSQ